MPPPQRPHWLLVVALEGAIAAALLVTGLRCVAHAQTAPLSIFGGGTGARTAKGARENLGVNTAIVTGLKDSLANYLYLPGRPANQVVFPLNPTNIALTLRGKLSQTGSIFLVENSAGGDFLDLDENGTVFLENSSSSAPQLQIGTIGGVRDHILLGNSATGGTLKLASTASTYSFALGGLATSLGFTTAVANFNYSFGGQIRAQLNAGDALSTAPTGIFTRRATQTSSLTRWADEGGTGMAAVLFDGMGYFQGVRLEDRGAGTNTITINPPSAPTTHTLTLPGANAVGLLANDGAGTLSWGGASALPTHFHSSATQGGQHLKPWASHVDSIPLVVTGGALHAAPLQSWVATDHGTVGTVTAHGGFNMTPAISEDGVKVNYSAASHAANIFVAHDTDGGGSDLFFVDASGSILAAGLSLSFPPYSGTLTAALNGNRTWTFPNVSMNVVGSPSVLATGSVPITSTNNRITTDTDLTWDGTNQLTATKMVATTSLKVGTGAVMTEVEKTLFNDFADAGNGTTVETDLYTHTTAANQLIADGDKLIAEFSGLTVAHATATRQLRVYFAGTLIWNSTALVTTAGTNWDVRVKIIRESATVVRCMTTMETTFPEGQTSSTYTRLTGLTLSGTNILKITGQAGAVGAATNDIVAKLGFIQYAPA